MESRLPKPNFQFKVPARIVNGIDVITSTSLKISTASSSSIEESSALKTSQTIISNGNHKTSQDITSNSNLETTQEITSNSNLKTPQATTTSTLKTSQTMSKTTSTINLNSKAADENKAPITRAKTMTTLSKTNVTVARGVQKRPGLVNNTIDSKRANLKTTMKPVVRPVGPATTVGPIGRAGASVVAAATAKPSGPKPSKWDLKGRLEYTNNELTALKQKHRELTTQHNDLKEEIIRLRESESTNRLKADSLEAVHNELTDKAKSLEAEIKELTKENTCLEKELRESKELYENVSALLPVYESDIEIKNNLIMQLEKRIEEIKSEYAAHQEASTNTINDLTNRNENLSGLVLEMDRDRRYLHNTIQELKGNIRVFCRVRPKIPKESSKSTCVINYLDECTLEVSKADDTSKMKVQKQEFNFDKVFPPNTSQADIFKELSMLVQSALEGYNVCVFAYGQTGSGKTYTMEGLPSTENEGMIPRTVKHIFDEMKHFELLGWEYKIEASFLEIYNEQIIDLLDYTRKSHEIKMADSKGNDLYVSNLLVQEINSPEELNQCLLIAQKNRAMAATQSNERSSRSHSVARIRLIATHKTKQEISIGNLNLVDLAGSERLKNEEAARIAETKNINKSLANLGHVILALLQKQDHIPYRNSKLTHLLMPSLGGNSKTLMLLNISPLEESFTETVNSLRFGSNVNNCKTGAVKKVKSVL